jgi:hypothetical protein
MATQRMMTTRRMKISTSAMIQGQNELSPAVPTKVYLAYESNSL